jgi:hypothetical protein
MGIRDQLLAIADRYPNEKSSADLRRLCMAGTSLADEPGNLNALQRNVPVSGEPISKGWHAWDANTQQGRHFA